MNKFIQIILILTLFISCKLEKNFIVNPRFSKVSTQVLLDDKISCRAIIIDSSKVWYAGNNGKYGFVSIDGTSNFSGNIVKDDLKLEFRSIAQTSTNIFILSIGNPALLYKIDKISRQVTLVYKENHEKVFYDSMQFLNDLEGFAVGDPTDNCPSFLKTVDGGLSWLKISCQKLPKFQDGEAFFATSNTNLIVKDNTIWLASGGKKSKIYRSQDKGITWEAFETPIVQGEAMTGIFTAGFYDENIGFITGGNYDKPLQNYGNKAKTSDGGKTWTLTQNNRGFGYASCVQYLPNSGGQSLVVVAKDGLFYFRKQNRKWKKIADISDLYTIRFLDNKTAIAAGKNKIVKLNFQ